MKKSFKFFLLINSIHLINWGELVAGKHLCGQLVSIYLLQSALFIACIDCFFGADNNAIHKWFSYKGLVFLQSEVSLGNGIDIIDI